MKWICGFSNAQGGKIYIGKNDKGKVVGVNNAKKLLEDIPNKVRDILGILVDVNLHETDKRVFIEIIVYDDKLMIWNYGQLPEDWTVENLLQKHSSIPYNPDIANAFFRAGHVESWGRGTIKIIEQCKEHGLPKPEFENDGKDFWIIFRKDIYNETHLKKFGINERQVKAVLYAKENDRITNKEYQSINNVSKRTATNDLTELVEIYKILNKIGTSGAGIYYKIMGH